MMNFGQIVKSLEVNQVKDLDEIAELCPNLESLTILDPELGIQLDRRSFDHLRVFNFDDYSFFLRFDFVCQVKTIDYCEVIL